jgi:hypothetical protein
MLWRSMEKMGRKHLILWTWDCRGMFLYLYCLKKAFAKSLHFLILALSNVMYQLSTELIKLSWKKCMSNLSSCTTSALLLQNGFRCVLRHSKPVYLTNSGTLNFLGTTTFGTRYMSVVLTRL